MASNNSINNQALNGFTASGGAISINSGTSSFDLSTDSSATNINIGTGIASKIVHIGSFDTTSSLLLLSGPSGSMSFNSFGGPFQVDSRGGPIILDSSNYCSINIGNIIGGQKTVILGSAGSSSDTTLQSGSSGITVQSNSGPLSINSTGGQIDISNDANATNINFGIGSAPKVITIGSLDTTSSTTIQGGTGGIQLSGTFVNLPTTTSTEGQVRINNASFMHAYGANNTFLGSSAGNFTAGGGDNTAIGTNALNSLSGGAYNVAIGSNSLPSYGGSGFGANVGVGAASLYTMTSGAFNLAIGVSSLRYLDGASYTIGIGPNCGSNYTSNESSNIVINSLGVTSESNTLRIGAGTGTGTQQLHSAFISGIFGSTVGVSGVPVVVDNADQLGTVVSSIKFKENIEDVGDYSSLILKLRPVKFDYISRKFNVKNIGLIAEEVQEVMPEMVVYNQKNEIETVRYNDLPVLLLNELKKALKRIELLEEKLAQR